MKIGKILSVLVLIAASLMAILLFVSIIFAFIYEDELNAPIIEAATKDSAACTKKNTQEFCFYYIQKKYDTGIATEIKWF